MKSTRVFPKNVKVVRATNPRDSFELLKAPLLPAVHHLKNFYKFLNWASLKNSEKKYEEANYRFFSIKMKLKSKKHNIKVQLFLGIFCREKSYYY